MTDNTRHPLAGATPHPTRGSDPTPRTFPQLWSGRVPTSDPVCRRLVAALANAADEYGRGALGIRTLARVAGTTSRTARTHLPHLVDQRRLMARVPAGGQNPVLTYWLASPLPPVPGGGR